MSQILDVILSSDPEIRNRSLDACCRDLSTEQLLSLCRELDRFLRHSQNLYHRVRALFFLYAICRFHLPPRLTADGLETGHISFRGYELLLARRFQEAIEHFQTQISQNGPSVTLTSALAEAYHRLAFQTLADQVRRSVRSVRGNQWMFRAGHPADLPLRIRPELLQSDAASGGLPSLRERTAVRMDFTHSAWSDIFFLGMDFPEGAQVINASIDLAVRGRHARPVPPIECGLRVIDEPVLRLVSVDLDARVDIEKINEVFDFARDYLGLLKAAVIAAGLIPPGMEGCGAATADVFSRMIGAGRGLEIVSRVNDIPKGSRLAVSTNLLGSLIAVCMRATGQVARLTGRLSESDRRIVAARAILGEWLGGSGGGWQDSGGIWPGIKLIQGAVAQKGDPEFGISRGRLLPRHDLLTGSKISEETVRCLQDSLVLVHGGMAQNVGPILEMVTEKYLLRSEDEWQARTEAIRLLEDIYGCLRAGDIAGLGRVTDFNFREPLQTIIPWCSNAYTEQLIADCRQKYGERFRGFWMLGGMSGGGMGFIFSPDTQTEAKEWLEQRMLLRKHEMESCVPFAMDPVVYDFIVNSDGTKADFCPDGDMPEGYYALVVPGWLKQDLNALSPGTRRELERVGDTCRDSDNGRIMTQRLLDRMLPSSDDTAEDGDRLEDQLAKHGFDETAHEQLREDLLAGRLGLAQNRLSPTVVIEDVWPGDFVDARSEFPADALDAGKEAVANGEVCVMTLSAGVGSRWTQGAGVVKALNPFCRIAGRFRSFLDVHLAKTRCAEVTFCAVIPHVVTTGYLTDRPIRTYLEQHCPNRRVCVSQGAAVGLRMVPTLRDLQFAWEESPQQILDEQQEKVRSSLRSALINWALTSGQATDYTDNVPLQCMHPVGHWYEVPNLLRNGVLLQILTEHPQLRYLMLHNIDTLGAAVDPGLLGLHIGSESDLSFEVISRRLEDRGGGLARVDGRVRLIEGLAMPREEDEFRLSFYNSMTTWITIDRLLAVFGLTRGDLQNQHLVEGSIRNLARRIPTYITLKDVKKRWGRGQEDVFPVSQFEKLWGDMTALSDVRCQYLVVPTQRGQQLKDPAQLDGWLQDRSAEYVESLCDWSS